MMDYYRVSATGDLNNTALALVEDPPEGMGMHDYRLVRGVKAKGHFPKEAQVRLRKQTPGIKLGGILGNTCGFFIGSRLAREIVEELCPKQEIEYLPFTLYNQKGRVHSEDYFFINPIGGFDCLKEEACGIKYDDDHEIVTIKQFVLDPKKLDKAPHFFRIHRRPVEYVVSRTLAQAWKDRGVTNVVGVKLRADGSK